MSPQRHEALNGKTPAVSLAQGPFLHASSLVPSRSLPLVLLLYNSQLRHPASLPILSSRHVTWRYGLPPCFEALAQVTYCRMRSATAWALPRHWLTWAHSATWTLVRCWLAREAYATQVLAKHWLTQAASALFRPGDVSVSRDTGSHVG